MNMGSLMYLCFLIFVSLHSQLQFSSAFPSSNNSSTVSTHQLCHHDQSFALLHFKNGFSFDASASFPQCDYYGQSSYPKMESWKKGRDCCSWDGVTCDKVTGHVIGIDLSCSWLLGEIHSNSTLFHLKTHLQWLNLDGNDFLGSQISSGFGQFSSLMHLNLSYSGFLSKIPSEISHLSKLISLDFSRNALQLETQSLKRLVQNLTELKQLLLVSVNMSSVELGGSLMNLSSSFTSLDLNSCRLRGKFPNYIYSLPNLQRLDLGYNLLLTHDFSNVNWSSSLKILDLGATNFQGKIPDSIGKLQSLNYLDLSNCNIHGSIPALLGNLTQITHLSLYSNSFNGSIPAFLRNLTQITHLDLSANLLNGSIPAFLGNLIQITHLDLSTNSLSGSIPMTIFKLVNLTYLSLSSNNLSGIVGEDKFINLKNLKGLHLSSNNLSWRTNSSVNFTLPRLTILGLSSCNLNEFPNFLRTSEYLEVLYISNNNIHGEIPNWVWDMWNDSLSQLDLSSNFLTSVVKLPWSQLQIIDLDSNLLQGPLPVPPHNTQFFSIWNNKLTGKIPSSICNVSYLDIIDLSYNNLSGSIPHCLGNFSNQLSVLNLRMNNFHGTIPRMFALGNTFRSLDFNGNQLEGPIPLSLINCTMLEVLDLGNNKIHATFPNWLDTLPELQVLVLQSNAFYGPLGDSNTKFPFSKLRIIDLSHNGFTGLLPTKYFKTLKAMINVDEEKIEKSYMGGYSSNGCYYEDSVMVTMKGLEFELVKIQTIFTTIDLSDNKFQGNIPKFIGNLNSLRVLNLSYNSLIGQIPSSLGNLGLLESLDISSNKLNGAIPWQLTNLTFLEVFNLSYNHLEGPIPLGKQFATFDNNSYIGNSGLCGFPLSKKCSNDETPPPLPLNQKEDNSEFGGGFGWKAVLMGYGAGTVIGLAWGYFIVWARNPYWFVRIVEGARHRKIERSNRSATRRRGGRKN